MQCKTSAMRQLVLLLAVVWLAGGTASVDIIYEDDYDVFGEEGVNLPICAPDEFLTSNGTHIFCRRLPDVGFCDCPDLIPTTVVNQTNVTVVPQPPQGCAVFTPPIGGAFACLRSSTTIYCWVLCDHRFEFSKTPRNPYYCGAETLFNWRDYPNGAIQQSLPECTGQTVHFVSSGFRHRPRLLHDYIHYLPSPCYGISDHTAKLVLEQLFATVRDGGCSDCRIEDSFIQCPQVAPTVTFYPDVQNPRFNYKRK